MAPSSAAPSSCPSVWRPTGRAQSVATRPSRRLRLVTTVAQCGPPGSSGRTWAELRALSRTTSSRRSATSDLNSADAACAELGTRSGGVPSASRKSPRISAGGASSPSPKPRRSAKSCPSGKDPAYRCAHCTAQAVLPTPAGPATTASGLSPVVPSVSTVVSAASWASRPRKRAGGRGSSRGGAPVPLFRPVATWCTRGTVRLVRVGAPLYGRPPRTVNGPRCIARCGTAVSGSPVTAASGRRPTGRRPTGSAARSARTARRPRRARPPPAGRLRPQNLLVSAPQPLAGVDTQLLVEQPPGAVEPLQRVGLPPRMEQRAHQPGDQAFPQGVVDGGGVEDGRGLFVLAERAVRPPQRLDGRQPALLQRMCGGRERRAGDRAGQRGPAPQPQRLAQQRYGVGRCRLGACQRHQLTEPVGVDQLLRQPQQIGRAMGGQLDAVRLRTALGERGAQPRDMPLDDRTGVFGRLLLPQGVDQLLQWDGGVGLQQQQGQHTPPFGGAERQLRGAGRHGDRTEQ